MTETIKECDGCFTKGKCIVSRTNWGKYYYTERIESRCPCYMCLVKVVCEGGCNDYSDFSTAIHKCLTRHVRMNRGVEGKDLLELWYTSKRAKR